MCGAQEEEKNSEESQEHDDATCHGDKFCDEASKDKSEASEDDRDSVSRKSSSEEEETKRSVGVVKKE